ncbi:MAG: hypothetical protein VX519_02030, partial [Myxococcota bacterium]|nr:hypothetical protein [Myxococcota bacterium]
MKNSPILVVALLSACGPTTVETPVFEIKPNAPDTLSELTVEISDKRSDLQYSVNWFQDGQGIAEFSGSNLFTIPAEETSRGEVWSALVVAKQDGLTSEPSTQSVTIRNSAPEEPELAFNPPNPTTSQPLRIHANANDVDGDPVSYIYQWYKDDVLQPDLTEAWVDASVTRSQETWNVVVEASDGDFSSGAVSLPTTIDNSPPELYGLSFANESPGTSDALQVIVDGEDPDQDTTTATFSFTVRGTTYDNGESDTFSSDKFERGDTVTVEVVLTDEHNATSEPAWAEVTIGNTLPTLTGAEVTALSASGVSPLRTDSIASCTPLGWEDPDFDPESIEVSWMVNGQQVATVDQTLDGSIEFNRDDQLTCIATPIDGFGAGEPVQSAVSVVENSPPTFSGVVLEVDNASSLDPLEANENSTITAAFTDLHDADGDVLETRVVWYIRHGSYGPGIPIWGYLSTDNGAEVCGEEYDRGDEIKAEAWPHDGIDDGELNGSAATRFTDWWTVVNTPPVVQLFHLDQADYQVNDTIYALLTGYDADGDTWLESYTWRVNNGTGTTTSSPMSTPADLQAVKGDHIEVSVQLDDQYNGVSAEVLSGTAPVSDTPPEVTNVSLTASVMDEVGAGTRASPLSTLTCSLEIADVDAADILGWSVDWLLDDGGLSPTVLTSQTGSYASQTSTSLDLSTVSVTLQRDNTIACEVTPIGDGIAGPPDAASIVVGNSPPVVEN